MSALRAHLVDGRVMLELPSSIAERLNVSTGGIVIANDEADGVSLTAADDDIADIMAAVEHVMAEHEWVLSELAK